MKKWITNTYEETRKVGVDFADHLHGGEVITLEGELGAGKTTFMQGLAKGLGIANNIISPTFIIMRRYVLPLGRRVKMLYHIDLYRITQEKDIIDLGLPELMGDPENIVAIEWPEIMAGVLPENTIRIKIVYSGDTQRTLTIEPFIG